jgi:hypothetical protein
MLIKLDQPRLLVSAQDYPQNLVFYCLACEGCSGDLGIKVEEEVIPIPSNRSMEFIKDIEIKEYVVPSSALLSQHGRAGSTLGISLVAHSSFRASSTVYGIRTFETTLIFPSNGGGVLRMSIGGQDWDLQNPTFDPRAEVPSIGDYRVLDYHTQVNQNRVLLPPEDFLRIAYQRVHKGYVHLSAYEQKQAELKRQERIANFDLTETTRIGPVLEELTQDEAFQVFLNSRTSRVGRSLPQSTDEPEAQDSPSRFDRLNDNE